MRDVTVCIAALLLLACRATICTATGVTPLMMNCEDGATWPLECGASAPL